jgi:Na+/H+ antiporter NhaD/arsenite permease-like protein
MLNIILVIFVLGYVLITLEHRYYIHKAVTAALLGATLWGIIAIMGGGGIEQATEKTGSEIFSLIMFLLVAMTLVEVLTHYGFFDYIRAKILGLGFGDYRQFWIIGIVTFFLSAVVDNLTATLVMLAIATRFFKGKSLLIVVSGIVIAANAGGAWSPIGDVTTIMLWLAKKFTASEIMLWGFLPSMSLFVVSMLMLSKGVSKERKDDVTEEEISISRSEWTVIFLALASFGLPLVAHQIGLPPYFGLLFGLGIVGFAIAIFRRLHHVNNVTDIADSIFVDEIVKETTISTHLTAEIDKKFANTDIAALVFFAGILLSVSALDHVGILEKASASLLGETPSIWRIFFGTSILGMFSAIVDNIPLTAAAMQIITVTDPAIWVLLALAVGTGGSLLVIGSAAGVVAMGQIKELRFFDYIKIATFPAFVGYAVALGVWLVEYYIFRMM